MNGNCVLLTATVTPNVSDHLVVSDPGLRLRQYQNAIAGWYRALGATDFSLAVVETSGAPKDEVLAQLPQSERSRVPFFHHLPTNDQLRRGKGAVELAAIEHALNTHDALVPESTVYKCTGRLTLLNVAHTVATLAPTSVRVRMTLDRSWADTRLVGATVQTWRDVLVPGAHKIDDDRNRYFERVMAAQLAPRLALGELQLERFPSRPIFTGVSGTSGRSYSPQLSRAKERVWRPLEDLLARVAARKQV